MLFHFKYTKVYLCGNCIISLNWNKVNFRMYKHAILYRHIAWHKNIHVFITSKLHFVATWIIFSATWYTILHLNSYACFNLFSTFQMQFLPSLFQPQSTVQWTGCFRQNLLHEIHKLIIKLPLILSWNSPVSTGARLQDE